MQSLQPQARRSAPNVADSTSPEGVDYDRWLGPAPERPFNRKHFHGGWHAYWAYSGGEISDDGIHQLDIARCLTGQRLPKAVHCTGGNFAFDDDREVPDTQVASYDFDDMLMTIEMTQWAPYMKKTPGDLRMSDAFPYWPQNATRIEFYGTKGLMILGRHGGGWQVFTNEARSWPNVMDDSPMSLTRRTLFSASKPGSGPTPISKRGT